MKKRKKQWLRMCNGMMSGALVLLGFTSCDENSTGTGRCEYGTPYAKYEIKGKVMGEDRQVVSDARILVKNMAPVPVSFHPIRSIRKKTENIFIRTP